MTHFLSASTNCFQKDWLGSAKVLCIGSNDDIEKKGERKTKEEQKKKKQKERWKKRKKERWRKKKEIRKGLHFPHWKSEPTSERSTILRAELEIKQNMCGLWKKWSMNKIEALMTKFCKQFTDNVRKRPKIETISQNACSY